MHDRELIDAQLKRMFFWLRESPYVPPTVVVQESEEEITDEELIRNIQDDCID